MFKINKHMVIRLLLCLEIVWFTYGYVGGRMGMTTLYAQKKENEQLATTIDKERIALKEVEQHIVAWHTDPFYKELYARQNLDMARPDEILYL